MSRYNSSCVTFDILRDYDCSTTGSTTGSIIFLLPTKTCYIWIDVALLQLKTDVKKRIRIHHHGIYGRAFWLEDWSLYLLSTIV